jgi:uncharacterized protein (DUF2147 family)
MKTFLAAAFLLSITPLHAQNKVTGIWMTEEGNSLIKIEIADDQTLLGTGAGGDNSERLDEKNPDPSLRNRPLLGSKILWGFRPSNQENSEWEGGKIYDPDTGKIYESKLQVDGDVLKIRGYVGIPLFGRTTVWKRKKS